MRAWKGSQGLRIAILLGVLGVPGVVQALPATIVVMRHGDKDADDPENHNLDSAGLQRSLALPPVLLGRYGTPRKIFVPTPGAKTGGNIRSLQLITPTAIAAKVNIDTEYPVGDEARLAEAILGDRSLDGSVVFIAWEHKAIPRLIEALGAQGPKKWSGSDFDSLWVLRYQEGRVVFSVDHEGLTPAAP